MASVLTLIAYILVIIGALNWGLIALFDFNLVEWINKYTFNNTIFERIIYGLVGLAALFIIYFVWKNWAALKALC
jgi:uncharacterized membrane protein YuzA (DUF378 family)